MRFTDVDIAELQYVALSYTWGSAQQTIINSGNKIALSEPGSLDGTVSATISDAILLTESLAFRFLWVDALCILQDDEPDKLIHLAFMSEIYKNAVFTIVAACGKDAAAGLTGLRQDRHNHQRLLKVKDKQNGGQHIHMITSQSFRPLWHNTTYFPLDQSFWATRGWTLQERVVSGRTLIFTPSEVYWSCRSASWSEGMFLETHLARPVVRILESNAQFLRGVGKFIDGINPRDDSDVAWDRFSQLARDFSSRSLTGAGDALDAFCAITQEVSSITGERFLWALPITRFELGLCWQRSWQVGAQARLKRRTAKTTLPRTFQRVRVSFPSWTWLGWEGCVLLRVRDQYTELG